MVTKLVSWIRIAYLVVAWLFVVGILGQVFLVGLALLDAQPTWPMHVEFGHELIILPLLLVVLSFVGRLPRAARGLTALLFGVALVQAEVFAIVRNAVPLLAALHPVLALVLFALAVTVAHGARAFLWEPRQATGSSTPESIQERQRGPGAVESFLGPEK